MAKQPSRANRFQEAKDKVSEASDVFQELVDELQSWRDSLPENLQSSSKAETLDAAISDLEQCVQYCSDIDGTDVEFPSMFC